jgi:PhnB protein
VDRTYANAIAAGALSVMPPQDQFWGDRYAHITDPFGHRWGISTPKENLTQDELKQRSVQHWKQPANK